MFRCACRCEFERLLGVYEKVLTLEAGGPVGSARCLIHTADLLFLLFGV